MNVNFRSSGLALPPLTHNALLGRARLTSSGTFAAPCPLQRLKTWSIVACGSSATARSYLLLQYTACALFEATHVSEAENKQHSDCHPFLRSWSSSIPAINCLFDSIGEVLAAVVGRVLPYPIRCPAASNSSILPLERPLPCQLNVPHDPAKLQGRQREDSLIRHFQHNANPGRQRPSTIPPRSLAKVFVTNTGAPEDADFNRHETYITGGRGGVGCSSVLASCEVQYRLRIRPAMRVVKLILIPFVIRPHSAPSWPILSFKCLDSMIF